MKWRQAGCGGSGLLILLLLVAIAGLIALAILRPSDELPQVGPAPETLTPTDSVPPLRTP